MTKVARRDGICFLFQVVSIRLDMVLGYCMDYGDGDRVLRTYQ